MFFFQCSWFSHHIILQRNFNIVEWNEIIIVCSRSKCFSLVCESLLSITSYRIVVFKKMNNKRWMLKKLSHDQCNESEVHLTHESISPSSMHSNYPTIALTLHKLHFCITRSQNSGVQCKFHHCGRLIFTSFSPTFRFLCCLFDSKTSSCSSTWIHSIILESYHDYAKPTIYCNLTLIFFFKNQSIKIEIMSINKHAKKKTQSKCTH